MLGILRSMLGGDRQNVARSWGFCTLSLNHQPCFIVMRAFVFPQVAERSICLTDDIGAGRLSPKVRYPAAIVLQPFLAMIGVYGPLLMACGGYATRHF